MAIPLRGLYDAVLQRCTNCLRCHEACIFLREYGVEPRAMVERLVAGRELDDRSLIYSCNLCGACQEICPEGIDLSRMFLLLREEAVEAGTAYPAALTQVEKINGWFTEHTRFHSRGTGAERQVVFFPGCNVAAGHPHLVMEAYSYLQRHVPSVGVMLECCGAPFEALGSRAGFSAALSSVRSHLQAMHASHLITACPSCYRVLRSHLAPSQVSTIYEVMAREGLPAGTEAIQGRFSFFHPCATRHERTITDAVYRVAERVGVAAALAADDEKAIACCGMGGAVGISNPMLACIVAQERCEGLHETVVTYCAACREALIQFRPTVHLLDLVFTRAWRVEAEKPPADQQEREANLLWLRAQLEKS